VFPNHLLSGSIQPAFGSVGTFLICSRSGLSQYILSLLIVALSQKNPFPLSLSGLLGFYDELVFQKAEFCVDLLALFPITDFFFKALDRIVPVPFVIY